MGTSSDKVEKWVAFVVGFEKGPNLAPTTGMRTQTQPSVIYLTLLKVGFFLQHGEVSVFSKRIHRNNLRGTDYRCFKSYLSQ